MTRSLRSAGIFGAVLLKALTLAMFVLAIALAAHAQFSLLYNLGTNTGDPTGPSWVGNFVQARDGNLYSTSPSGGTGYPYEGTVFQLTPAGKVNVLHNFADDTAYNPQSGLTLGTDGNLYGTTVAGWGNGNHNDGTIFRISTSGDGTFKILHYFSANIDGLGPLAPPIQAMDGNFYGTTGYGKGGVGGSVYRMTLTGNVTTLVSNLGGHAAGIMQASDGNFYGTVRGVNAFPGRIFKITPAPGGKYSYSVVHNFAGYKNDGYDPAGTIIQASDGNLYGTTVMGGTNNTGTIYRITLAGAYKVIFTFPPIADGRWPTAGLVQGTDGYLYGATMTGGKYSGTLFRVNLAGTIFKVLYNFTSATGVGAQVPLFQHTNGIFYGDAYEGGSHPFDGTVYSLKTGLAPFIALVTTLGKAGQTIEILGNGLTGTTSVKFGTGSASFKVVSDTYMTATVPATGTTGAVIVTIPSGFRVSSKNFRVQPVISGFGPGSGAVGSKVVITGTGLTETSKVTFGGVAATTFTKSATQVTVIVPAGAMTGKIAITTPGGTATSAAIFTVT